MAKTAAKIKKNLTMNKPEKFIFRIEPNPQQSTMSHPFAYSQLQPSKW